MDVLGVLSASETPTPLDGLNLQECTELKKLKTALRQYIQGAEANFYQSFIATGGKEFLKLYRTEDGKTLYNFIKDKRKNNFSFIINFNFLKL